MVFQGYVGIVGFIFVSASCGFVLTVRVVSRSLFSGVC